jgi:hypothetical protein
MIRARLGDSDVFMSEDQAPAFSSSVNSITDPSKVKGVSSTTIRIISTKESRRVLGSATTDRMPSTQRPILRIGNDDADLFRAEVTPVSHDRNEIECIALASNASWFDFACVHVGM